MLLLILLTSAMCSTVNSLGYSCQATIWSRKPHFVHIPKTGGTSVESWLRLKTHDHRRHDHQKPNEFSFAFVRNPYDKMRSWYTYCRNEVNAHHKIDYCLLAATLEFNQWVGMVLDRITQRCGGKACFQTLQLTPSGWCSRLPLENCLGPSAFWLLPDEHSRQYGVNWIGKYEHLANDTRCLIRVLFKNADKIIINEKIRVHWSTEQRNIDVYYNASTKARVRAIFDIDFRLFYPNE